MTYMWPCRWTFFSSLISTRFEYYGINMLITAYTQKLPLNLFTVNKILWNGQISYRIATLEARLISAAIRYLKIMNAERIPGT